MSLQYSRIVRSRALHGPEASMEAWMNPDVQANRREGIIKDKSWRILFQKLSYGEVSGFLLIKEDFDDPEAKIWKGIVATRIYDLKSHIGGIACLMPERGPSSLLASGQWHDPTDSRNIEDLLNSQALVMEELDTMVQVQ